MKQLAAGMLLVAVCWAAPVDERVVWHELAWVQLRPVWGTCQALDQRGQLVTVACPIRYDQVDAFRTRQSILECMPLVCCVETAWPDLQVGDVLWFTLTAITGSGCESRTAWPPAARAVHQEGERCT